MDIDDFHIHVETKEIVCRLPPTLDSDHMKKELFRGINLINPCFMPVRSLFQPITFGLVNRFRHKEDENGPIRRFWMGSYQAMDIQPLWVSPGALRLFYEEVEE